MCSGTRIKNCHMIGIQVNDGHRNCKLEFIWSNITKFAKIVSTFLKTPSSFSVPSRGRDCTFSNVIAID